MNTMLGTRTVKRNVRWATDLGFDRYYALWSQVQGSDLYLYECAPAGALKKIATYRDRHFDGADIAALEFAGSSDRPLQFAAGLTNGEAVISSFTLFDLPVDREHEKVVLNPISRQGRVCNTVAWNQVHEGRLLTVLGSAPENKGPKGASSSRARDYEDPCLYVWDLSQAGSSGAVSQRDHLSSPSDTADEASIGTDSSVGASRGSYEYHRGVGVSRSSRSPAGVTVVERKNPFFSHGVRDEGGNCAGWLHQSAHTLVLGCKSSLRFIDIRVDREGEVNRIHTPTSLLACDPLEDTRIATYSGERGDLEYKIWDWRMLSKSSHTYASTPLQTCLAPGLRTHALQWSPTRRSVLTALVSSSATAEAGSLYTWTVRSNMEPELSVSR